MPASSPLDRNLHRTSQHAHGVDLSDTGEGRSKGIEACVGVPLHDFVDHAVDDVGSRSVGLVDLGLTESQSAGSAEEVTGVGTVSTGHAARRTTRSAVLPNSMCRKPV